MASQSLVADIASALGHIYRNAKRGCFKKLFSESYKLGSAIFKPFDHTVKFAESAKESWNDTLVECPEKKARRLTAVSKVGRELDETKKQIEELTSQLQKRAPKTETHRELVDEGLRSTSLYARWYTDIKDDLANAYQHSDDSESNIFEGLHEKWTNYAGEIRKQQNLFQSASK